jgi:D-mannonate dehydratase
MAEEINPAVDIEYNKMLHELITNLYKERIRALAQCKVVAEKYNEVLKLNTQINIELLKIQETLSHTQKELERLKRKTNAKSKGTSE